MVGRGVRGGDLPFARLPSLALGACFLAGTTALLFQSRQCRPPGSFLASGKGLLEGIAYFGGYLQKYPEQLFDPLRPGLRA